MKPRYQTTPTLIVLAVTVIVLSCLAMWILPTTHAQGQVQVSAADPMAAEQGTINLNVKVTGKGFKNGAQAKWFVTGTTNPGGVTVVSTTYVSSTELTANINVADTAAISPFDIQVLNADGRGGKGTELFKVTAKQAKTQCPPIQPAPIGDTKCYAAMPGCLDSTFGGGIGYIHTDAAPNYVSGGDEADAVAAQPDGKIVVAGRTRISSTEIDYTVLRYNVDGSLDTSFGDISPSNPSLRLGYALTPIIAGGFDYPRAMNLQPDGKIVVSGSANSSNSVVVRYNLDGTLDSAFGNNGIVQLPSGSPNNDLALQSDGKIVIGGASPGGFALVRLNANGSLDTNFGSRGTVTANPSGSKTGSGSGSNLAIQRVPALTGEERIVLSGWSKLSSNDNSTWTVMRFVSTGAVDTSFGTNGIVKTYFSGFGDQARMIQVDSSNRVVVAGITKSADLSCGSYVGDVAVVRYNENGSLDGSFGGGKQVLDIYGGNDTIIRGLAIQRDGKILASGTTQSSDASKVFVMLVRLNFDGSRDSTFGLLGNGVVTTDLYGTQSWGFALALNPIDDKVIVAGGAYLGPNFTDGQMIVARYQW